MTSNHSLDNYARRAERNRKHFERRKNAALAGIHLPTEHELLIGMPFLGGDIQHDIRTFAERLMPRLRQKADNIAVAAVVYRLEQLTVGAEPDEIRNVADALAGAWESLPATKRSWQQRCRIYLAYLGDHGAALDLARDAVVMAASVEGADDSTEQSVEMLRVALGWLSFAACDVAFRYFGKQRNLHPRGASPAFARQSGASLVALIEQQARTAAYRHGEVAEAAPRHPASDTEAFPLPSDLEQDECTLSAVVFRQVGNEHTGEGKKLAKEFNDLLGKPLPLVVTPDLAAIGEKLRWEFPHAQDVIDRLLQNLAPRKYAQVEPTILVGAQGCGKSRFARRFLTLLNMPHDIIPCGGVSDARLAGTSRGWSSGEPSLPLALITRYKLANPGAVLDEVEKVGTSHQNGNLHAALLAMLERETACQFFDPYIEAACDVSHVTWLMTANSLVGLSVPFRDRCQILQFPDPRSEDLAVLSRQIIVDILEKQGFDHRWATPLDEAEMNAIAQVWRGGSLRPLRRMIERALNCRDLRH
ncbi:hypothetical protein [Microvirga brassicacearum]|uniref:AAA family ATPase n=1 Tax=Microvirga brassicacearum TaxID=2580413 RepID=A0A5N3P973_9HYPH|nr:hypothetical protein [Microvirga brassicacearum]KAB0266286.1 hypothetical protein FEZ63_14470 [Microvirga brassicacearum]